MLRTDRLLSRHGLWRSLLTVEQAYPSLGACCQAINSASSCNRQSRAYAEFPDPDPDLNPTPSENVVKIADAIENLTVKESVWLNKLLKERLGITDADLGFGMAMPMQAAPAGGAQEAAAEEEEKKPEQTEFDVVIDSYEATAKIKIIKEVRTIVPDLGLKEAKEMVEKLPAKIKQGVSKEDAAELKKKLESLGAVISVA